jgi:hypothetical protein
MVETYFNGRLKAYTCKEFMSLYLEPRENEDMGRVLDIEREDE